jgi:uncharacterized protein
VHLVTTSSVAALAADRGTAVDARLFRANLVLDNGDGQVDGAADEQGAGPAYAEDGWLGRRIALGEALLEVVQPMPRCVMVDMPQVGVVAPGGVLRTLTDRRDGDFGLLLDVVRPGLVRVGDEAVLQEPATMCASGPGNISPSWPSLHRTT